MKIKIAENIRSFRKEHSLTQEQLADLFEISVDVLLGYEQWDRKLQVVAKELSSIGMKKILKRR